MKTVVQLFIAVLLVATFSFFSDNQVQAKTFPDVDPTSEVGLSVDKLSTLGIVTGKPNGNYAPNDFITRAEAAKIMFGILELDDYANESNVQVFKDVKPTHWAFREISTINDWDVMTGYTADKFGPNDNLTRGQMAHLLKKVLSLPDGPSTLPFKDVKSTAYYFKGVSSLYASGITKGKSTTIFDPNGNVTRGELALFLNRSGILDTLLGSESGYNLSALETVSGKVLDEKTFKSVLASYKNDIWGILPATFRSDIYFDEDTFQFENLTQGEAIFDINLNDYDYAIYLKVTVNSENVASYQFYTPATLKALANKKSGTTELTKLLNQIMAQNNFDNSDYLNQFLYFDDPEDIAYFNYIGDEIYYFEFNDTTPITMHYDFLNGASGNITITPYVSNGSYDYHVKIGTN